MNRRGFLRFLGIAPAAAPVAAAGVLAPDPRTPVMIDGKLWQPMFRRVYSKEEEIARRAQFAAEEAEMRSRWATLYDGTEYSNTKLSTKVPVRVYGVPDGVDLDYTIIVEDGAAFAETEAPLRDQCWIDHRAIGGSRCSCVKQCLARPSEFL